MEHVADILRTHRVADLGPLPAPRLPGRTTIQQALAFLVRGRRGAIVAVEPGTLRPVGIFTERDVLTRLCADVLSDRAVRARKPLTDVMSSPCISIRRRASLHEAIDTMASRGFRHLVVVDRHGELQGLLTTGDVVQYLTDRFPEETVNLPPRLHQRFPSAEGA